MALRKKGTKAIAQALKMVDDKAEFNVVKESVSRDNDLDRVDDLLPVLVPTLELPVVAQLDVKQELTINDFAKALNSEDPEGLSYYLPSEPVGSNVTSVYKKVTLGLTDWEYQFLAAYSLLPSLFCRILPIVEINGQAGTGKSQLLVAMAKVSNNSIISGQSTGASLKNYINVIRWADPESKSIEKNCLLFIDNLNEDCFKKEEYLSSFLNGYSRATDRTFISNGKGQNIEFKTFCGKVYTTIWGNDSTELRRRTITIKTHKITELDGTLEPDDINWHEIKSAVFAFWQNSDNWSLFSITYKLYGKIPKPKHSKEYWVLLRDVIVTGVVTGVWASLETAIDSTALWLENTLKTRLNLLETVILQSLERILGISKNDWEEMSKKHKIHVSPRNLKDAIEQSVNDGLIERPKLIQVQQVLSKFGFLPGKKDGTLGYLYKGKKTNDEH